MPFGYFPPHPNPLPAVRGEGDKVWKRLDPHPLPSPKGEERGEGWLLIIGVAVGIGLDSFVYSTPIAIPTPTPIGYVFSPGYSLSPPGWGDATRRR